MGISYHHHLIFSISNHIVSVSLCSYGDQGAGKTIPPNSWLVFDVELVAVN